MTRRRHSLFEANPWSRNRVSAVPRQKKKKEQIAVPKKKKKDPSISISLSAALSEYIDNHAMKYQVKMPRNLW